MTNSEFIALVKEMRDLGAMVVEAHGYKAVFPPKSGGQPAKPAAVEEDAPPLGETPRQRLQRQRAKMLGVAYTPPTDE